VAAEHDEVSVNRAALRGRAQTVLGPVADSLGPALMHERTIISHIDRTIFDTERLFRLADSGCVVEFDLFGQESSYYRLADIDMPNDALRLRAIRALIERGHLERVVVSHDICYQTRLVAFGGHGYGHIFANVVPMMRRRGFSEAEIQAIVVDTPRRLLTVI